jgi:hypothetical protein
MARRPTLHQLCLFPAEIASLAADGDTIIAGDWIEARGGPVSHGEPLVKRGVYRIRSIIFRRGRTWLDCWRMDLRRLTGGKRQWLAGGTFLLYVAGNSYRSKEFPGVIWRPFKVKKLKPA